MAVSEVCELRLLRCALCRPNAEYPMHAETEIESSLLQAIEFIEQGLYSQVAAMEIMRRVFGDPRECFAQDVDPNRAVYDKIASNVRDFVDKNDELSASMLVMSAGVAFLFIFLQSNFTGPQATFPAFPTSVAWNLGLCGPATEKAWDTWARKELMIDGCDMTGKCAYPQYLLLVNVMIEAIKSSKEPSTRVWWSSRALFAQQRILDERSPTLLKNVRRGYSEVLQLYGMGSRNSHGWRSYLTADEENLFAASASMEAALVEYYYGYSDKGRFYIVQSEKTAGLNYTVEGAIGYRRQYQVEPMAQMVLKDESELEVLQNGDESIDGNESDVLLHPRLESTKREFLHQKVLNATQQCVLLARCVDVKKASSEDELRSSQMAPYIEAVDTQHSSPFMVKCWCQLLRVEREKSRAATRERSFTLMETIVSDIRGEKIPVFQRMHHFFFVSFPCFQSLLRQWANMLVSFGMLGEALKLFEELELWHDLIDCHRLLGDTTIAVSLIKEHLKVSPSDPRLWCSLGEATNDDACLLKSWEVSGQRFARAQRGLARSALIREDYADALKHWDLALALNPLHSDGWFSAGFAALKTGQRDKALEAFVQVVKLDPENAEAYNNIAALNIRKKSYKEANKALEQAVKFQRNLWQLWDNQALVLIELGNYSQAAMALAQVFDLSPKNVHIGLLSTLVRVLEEEREHKSLEELELDRNTKKLLDLLGGLISKMASNGDYGGEIWGLKARWHKVVGQLDACKEALLRQVRAYQGSNWQHDESRFRTFAHASLQLCRQYLESGSKRELSSAQRHLTSILKQGQQFEHTEEYRVLEELLNDRVDKC